MNPTRSRVKLVLILVLFLLPPVGAWLAWKQMGDAGTDSTTNAGTLIQPARPVVVAGLVDGAGRPIADDALRSRWTYVLFVPGDCGERCQEQLYLTRQVRMAMNKDIPRVQRLALFGASPGPGLLERLEQQHGDLQWAVLGEAAKPFLDEFQGAGFGNSGNEYFLVDPLGNLMMFYTLDVPAKGMMKDLRKLLKISQIG